MLKIMLKTKCGANSAAATPFSQPIKKNPSQIGRPRHVGLFLGRKIEPRVEVEVVAQVWGMGVHFDEVVFDVIAAEVSLW